MLPKLQNIHGNLSFNSEDEDFDCNVLWALKSSGRVFQDVSCQGKVNSAAPSTSVTSTFGPSPTFISGDISSAPGPSDKVGIGVGVGVSVIVLFFAIGFILMWRKKKRRGQSPALSGQTEAPNFGGKPELSAESYVREVDGELIGRKTPEFPTQEALVELPGETSTSGRQELPDVDAAQQIGVSDEVRYSREMR